MRYRGNFGRIDFRAQETGFSLLELMVAVVILLAVTGTVMTAMMQMTLTQGTVANRTEMHSSVRSATEVLQQEIGQAGKISLPALGPTTMSTAVTLGADPNVPVTATVVLSPNANGLFNGMRLVVDTGDNEETVTVSNLISSSNSFTGTFALAHAANAPVRVAGTFANGIVPTTATNGSDGYHLKLFGDINDDQNMVYVEYTCDTAGHNLYRNSMSFTAASKPALSPSMIILPNIQPNPPDPGTTTPPAPCFKYQEKTVAGITYDVDVSVTLTVQTQNVDPQTNQFQKETKALLNVSPRNVFEGWQLAAGGVANRIQPIPASVVSLLP